jgi:ankyrin repeat protein
MLLFFYIRDNGNIMTPLFCALDNCRIQTLCLGFIEIVRMLISAGANVNAVST